MPDASGRHADAFAAGMAKQGQTREHAMLAYVLGIRYVVIAINKLDTFPAASAKKRHDECKAEVVRYLKRVGLNQVERISIVPVSATHGHNITTPAPSWSWCVLPHFLDVDVPSFTYIMWLKHLSIH
jgi:elongation factor 1-alpha